MAGDQPRDGERFSSRGLFLISTIGASVGLGNIWRFPFVAGENGGGAFLVPYIAAMVAIAMPMAAIELATGRTARAGIVGSLRQARRWAFPIGLAVAVASTVVLANYLVVTGWTLGYAVNATAGSLPTFSNFTDGYASLWWFGASALIALLVVARGVTGGIELISKVLTPLLVVILIGLALYAVTLDSFGEAARFYLVPEVDELLEPITWVAAFGQVFFSVGVGMGVLVTYGAYVDERQNLAASAIGIALADAAIAVIAGFVVFPLAFSIGQSPDAGPQLAFDSLPEAFRNLDLAGSIIAVLFYFSLFAAALTSAISLLEVAVIGLREVAGIGRRRATLIIAVPIGILGGLSALSYASPGLTLSGTPLLDVIDHIVGRFALPLGVLATASIVCWWKPEWIIDGLGAGRRMSRGALLIGRWLVPVAVLAAIAAQLR